ncbi:hypothetical protein BDP27DRAFT_1431381 [Rhodocollybia butyracea]|uniref:FAD-binding PCMH-type domain-containing protein n=1 Tax=Rhodocollybia butyracea TaxID=206335 RepID=A0A9P5P6Z6_9AGAR|nr:hypothetical protein BDP27DRAFT_1431381 [Rhodocollybia butyracea]
MKMIWLLRLTCILLGTFGAAASAQSSSPTNSSSTLVATAARTCNQIQQRLGPSLVQSKVSGSQYEFGANAAWNLFNTDVNFQPTCIVFVTNAEDVQVAMSTIFENGADYAVQAGGHSAMKGWNTLTDGVLISFVFMNATSYDQEKDTITLLPGIHWGDALTELEPFGVAPLGARVNTVGTGLLLGGGISYLSPAFGYAADTFVSLDVVLVNGTLVTATVDNEYADLFRALKGGANRFGIVTRYEVQAVHVGGQDNQTWWGGLVIYPNSSAEAVLAAAAHHAQDVNDTHAALLTIFGSVINNDSSIEAVIETAMFYNGPVSAFNETFAELLSIPSVESVLGPLSYLDVSDVLAQSANASGFGETFGASVLAGESITDTERGFADGEDPYLKTFSLFTNFTETFAPSNKITTAILAFTPILDAQIRVGVERGRNAIDPPLGNGGFNAVQFSLTFAEGVLNIPEDIEAGRDFYFANAPSTPGLPLYINECDEKQHVFETYGGFEFLKTVYAKYDPTRFNVQHTRGPIGL